MEARIKKSKIYTKAGDQGQTKLVNGKSVSKGDLRIEVYGDVDELNSFLGMACSQLMDKMALKAEYLFILSLQSLLFNLGSLLACERMDFEKFRLPVITEGDINLIELEIDRLDIQLPPLKNFVLPGGGASSACLHVCRTVCRRAERHFVFFSQEYPDEAPPLAGELLNRLSDFFFVLSRYICMKEGNKEILWTPKN